MEYIGLVTKHRAAYGKLTFLILLMRQMGHHNRSPGSDVFIKGDGCQKEQKKKKK